MTAQSVAETQAGGLAPDSVLGAIIDPTSPIPSIVGGALGKACAPAHNQKNRRAVILATIRQLLLEEGCDGVTVRKIAERSGYAVQTVYNLVGPRDTAITEAICEYCQHIGLGSMPEQEDLAAAAEKFDHEWRSIEANPEYCRRVCRIFFSESRHIFYEFRDRQVRCLSNFLSRQKKRGFIRPEVHVQELAQQLMLFSSSMCVEWTDRPFPLQDLHHRLHAGYANLLSGAVGPGGDRLYLALTARA